MRINFTNKFSPLSEKPANRVPYAFFDLWLVTSTIFSELNILFVGTVWQASTIIKPPRSTFEFLFVYSMPTEIHI